MEEALHNRIRIITHRGHKIISVDTSGLKSADIATLLPILTKTAIDYNVNLICNNATNASLSFSTKRNAQDSIARARAAVGTVHSAIVGIRGIRKLLANALQKDHYFASNKEEALDWLVRQASK